MLCFVEVAVWLAGSTDFSEPEVLDLLTAEHFGCLLKQHDVVGYPTFLWKLFIKYRDNKVFDQWQCSVVHKLTGWMDV